MLKRRVERALWGHDFLVGVAIGDNENEVKFLEERKPHLCSYCLVDSLNAGTHLINLKTSKSFLWVGFSGHWSVVPAQATPLIIRCLQPS
jgi:hypothetical protein